MLERVGRGLAWCGQQQMSATSRIAAVLVSVLALAAGAGTNEPAAVSTPLEQGWAAYRLNEFDRCVRFFEQAVDESPTNSEVQYQARYGLATTWNLRRPGEDREKARGIFEGILAGTPSDDLRAWTKLALVRMKHLVPVGEEPDMAAVLLGYQEIIDQHRGHLAAKESFIYKMSIFIATLREPETRYALACLSHYVSQPGQKEFVQPAWSLMAVGYTTLKDQPNRLLAEIRSLETTEIDPTNPYNEFAWAYWNIATLAEFECGDFATARAYYTRLLKEYPTDIKGYATKQALKRLDDVETKLRAEIRAQTPAAPVVPAKPVRAQRPAGRTS